MKFINKILILSAIVAGVASCAVEAPQEEVKHRPDAAVDAVPGQLLVRFDPHVAEILDKAGLTKSGPAAPMTRSGILSVDEVLDLVDGYSIERVFPADPRSESKAREEGLHLWYVVRFNEDCPVAQVAEKLSQLGEVSRLEFNRTLKRASEGKAVPLTAEKLRQLTAKTSSSAFNDPLLADQWHLVNNGDLRPTKFVKDADVQVEKAWTELNCYGDPSIIVAVLDEGVDVTHPDLKASMWVNEDEIWRSTEDNDGNGYAGDYHGYNFVQKTGVISTDSKYDSGHEAMWLELLPRQIIME